MLELLFNKVTGLKACSFIKKRLQHRYFPVNIAKPSRTHTSKNIYNQLLFDVGWKLSMCEGKWLWHENYWPLSEETTGKDPRNLKSLQLFLAWITGVYIGFCQTCTMKLFAKMQKQMFADVLQIGVIKNFAIFTGKYLC